MRKYVWISTLLNKNSDAVYLIDRSPRLNNVQIYPRREKSVKAVRTIAPAYFRVSRETESPVKDLALLQQSA